MCMKVFIPQHTSPHVQKHTVLNGPSPSLCRVPPSPCCPSPPRYIVLDTSADLVLEARFRGNFYTHEWVYSEDDPTFISSAFSLFTPATRTNVGQTYTIPAGSASLRVGYYGPTVLPTLTGTPIRPTPENTVIVGSFGKCTTTDSVAPQVKTLSGTHLLTGDGCSPYTLHEYLCT